MIKMALKSRCKYSSGFLAQLIGCRGYDGSGAAAEPGALHRLKKRSLDAKRRLALGEFALDMESLERFVAAEPLYRVHECVFAVLTLESEPVNPRL